MLPIAVEALIKIALLIGGLMTGAAYLVLSERWIAAWIQDRIGPNRVGIPLTKIRLFGLGQPLADGVKFLCKEDFAPDHVDKVFYFLAPVAIFMAAIAVYAVIPFGSVLPAGIFPASWGVREPIHLVVAPGIDVGVLYIFAVSSVSVYGVLLGGWSSDTKYSFLGGLRAIAQLVSYELPLGLGLLGVVLASGSLRLEAIITAQAHAGLWNILAQPLGFLVFAIAAAAEAGRLPFDLYEAEQELVGGYHTEYSGMKLLLFLVAEYLHMITVATLIAILFLGGWHLGRLTGLGDAVTWPVAILRVVVLQAKVLGVVFCFMVARWSWPRFRFDQLMAVAWRTMLPLGMVNVAAVAVGVEYGPRWAAAAGVAPAVVIAAIGWGTFGIGLLAMILWAPAASDNRPRREPLDAMEGLVR